MSSTGPLFKIPLLLAVLWAHKISYSSPNPFVAKKNNSKEGEMVGCVRIMRPAWARKASKTVTRIVVLSEIVAILAWHLSSSASTYTLSVLDHDPSGSGAGRIRITPTFALGWMLIIAGGLVRLACYRTLGKHFTFEVTIQDDHRLVTTGPYSIVRHPSYTAMAMVVLGTIVASFGPGSWLSECGILAAPVGKLFALVWVVDMLYVPAVMVFLRVAKEDGLLRKEFGGAWDEWARRTPYALLPGIY
ncbi:hypothetical protein C8Q77DRAFT_1158894 [Trametes polyzona]|nr:hypothetical protein C8Q77DRAFT_1158894 [Trametes polyzona]